MYSISPTITHSLKGVLFFVHVAKYLLSLLLYLTLPKPFGRLALSVFSCIWFTCVFASASDYICLVIPTISAWFLSINCLPAVSDDCVKYKQWWKNRTFNAGCEGKFKSGSFSEKKTSGKMIKTRHCHCHWSEVFWTFNMYISLEKWL